MNEIADSILELLFYAISPIESEISLQGYAWVFYILIGLIVLTVLGWYCFSIVPRNCYLALRRSDGSMNVLEGPGTFWTPGQSAYPMEWTNPFINKLRDHSMLMKQQRFEHKFTINNDEERTFVIRVGVYFTLNKEIFVAEEPLLALSDVVIDTANKFFANWNRDVDLTHQEKCHKTPFGKALKKAMKRKDINFAKLDLLQIQTKRQKFGAVFS